MSANTENTAEIDPARSVRLGDHWHAAVCVNPDGEESLWLLAPHPGNRHGCACAHCAPHDQLTPCAPTTASTTTTPTEASL